MSGWVLLWRGFWESPDFKPEPFSEREAFLWSITQAGHSAHLQWFNGVQVPVERGEFATSSRKLAATFKWSEKRARSFIGRMQKRGNWTLRTPHEGAHLATIISVCNYERFQTPGRHKDAPSDAPKGAAGTHQGRTSDAQQKEEINNSNEGEAKKEASPSRSLAPVLPYGDAVAAWSQIAAIKRWSPEKPTMPLSDKRRRGLSKILSAHGFDGWVAALQRAADSELLGGPDPPGWFNFNFVCNPDNFTKLHEGNYDRAFSGTRSTQRTGSTWLAANSQLGGSAFPDSGSNHCAPVAGV